MRMEAKSSRIDVEKINGLSKASSVEPSQRRRESVALSSLEFKRNETEKRGGSQFFGVFFFLSHSLSLRFRFLLTISGIERMYGEVFLLMGSLVLLSLSRSLSRYPPLLLLRCSQ